MTDYTKLKVSELKELLKERDLPLSGTKSELVNRLEADDAAKGEPAGDAVSGDATEPAAEDNSTGDSTVPVEAAGGEQPGEEGPNSTADRETAQAETTQAAEVEEPAEPEEPEMSQAEAQQRVIDELEQRLKRHKRFATDPTDTELRLKRIRQFGLADINEAKKLVTFKPAHRKRRVKGNGKKVSA